MPSSARTSVWSYRLSSGSGTERVPCPWVALLAFAPALSSLVGPPGAAVLVVLAHLYAVLAAPAFRLLGALRG